MIFPVPEENHTAAFAVWFTYYNFCRVHSTLRVTPAMEAGVADHAWNLEELCELLPKPVSSTTHIDKMLIQTALRENVS
jgi:hypothetical protein